MSLEAIVDRILRDARQRASQIEGESGAQVQSIRSQCEETIHALQETSRKRAEKLAEEQRKRILSIAELDIRKEVLALKQKMIERAFEKALSQVLEGDEEGYSALLKKLILKADPEGDEELILNQKDRERMGNGFIREMNESLLKADKKGKLKLAPESRPIRGGVILRRGRKEVNCSVESIIYLKRDELEAIVARILFPDVKEEE
ncbi:MAG: V-type ATP synthase subunit E [Syntrophobacterales bacterium]|nr:MAG: V-type ATP synthase subunit E [Syntrophobacterales bacterium]